MKKIFSIFLVVLGCIQFCFADRLSSAIYDGDLDRVKSCIEDQGIEINRINNTFMECFVFSVFKTKYP